MMRRNDLESLAREMQGKTPLGASVLLFAILGVVLCGLIWAIFTHVDDVTRATGKVVPAGDLQRIQAAKDGLIRAVLVREGDIVEADAPLLELDAEVQTGQLAREVQRAMALQAKIERLNAEIDGTDLVFSAAVETQAPELANTERALHLARANDLAAQIAVLERQRQQRLQEQDAMRIELRTAKSALSIVAEERSLLAPLVERGVEPRTTLLSLRQREEELQGRIAGAEAGLARLDAALLEIDDTVAATHSRHRAEALREKAEATADLASLRPTLPALESLADRAILRAPVRGIVNRLHRSTVGGAIRAGEDIAEIVPIDDHLLVEAFLPPQDIAFIQPGQPVRVKLTAYDYTRYGMLDGEIIRIGADAVRRSQNDETEVFVLTVQTKGGLTGAYGAPVRILPGMTAEVDILAGKRRIISYLLQPLERVTTSAFRE